MKYRFGILIVCVMMTLLISKAALGLGNEVYFQDFNASSALEQFRPDGKGSSFWVLDKQNKCLIPSGYPNNFETRRFDVNRDDGKITFSFSLKFLAEVSRSNKNTSRDFTVTVNDREGDPLYGLRIVLENDNESAEFVLEKYSDKNHTILKKVEVLNFSFEKWIDFRMEFNPTTEFGGDGSVRILGDCQNGEGLVEYINICDEAYMAFSTLQFASYSRNQSTYGRTAIDNIKVTEEVSENLIQNPGFENDFEAWEVGRGWRIAREEGLFGEKTAIYNNFCDDELFQGKNYRESIAGAVFVGTAWIKTKNVQKATLKIIWKNSFDRFLNEEEYSVSLNGTSDWSRLRVEGAAPLGATQVWLKIEADGKGSVWVDECGLRQRLNTNLLQNGGFEAGLANWQSTADWSAVSGNVYEDSQAAGCVIPLTGEPQLLQGVNLKRDISGLEFILSGWFKSVQAVPIKVRLRWKKASEEWIDQQISSAVIEGASSWQEFELIGLAPDGAIQAWVEIAPQTGYTGEFTIDDISLRERIRPNLLHNSGFEDGINGWSAQGGFDPETDGSRIGDQCLVLSGSGRNFSAQAAQGIKYGRDMNGIPIIATTWIKAETGVKAVLSLNWKDSGGKWLNDQAVAVVVEGDGTWSQYSVKGVAPKGAIEVWLRIQPETEDRGAKIWVDGCTLGPCHVMGFSGTELDSLYSFQFKPEFLLPGMMKQWEWDFNGDQKGDNYLENPVYTFPSSGEYNIRFQTTDATGAPYWTRQTIEVPESAQILSLTWTETEGFQVEANINYGGQIKNIIWNFGDGSSTTTTETSVIHAYKEAGIYLATVTVVDSFGVTVSKQITVEAPASVEAKPTVTTVTNEITGAVEAGFSVAPVVNYGGTIASIVWDFNDGFTVEGVAATHTYTIAGNYYPTLTIADSFGNVYSYSLQEIKVVIPVKLELELSDGQVCGDYFTLQGNVVYDGEIQAVAILVDGVEQTVIAGSKAIGYTLDTYLLSNGVHTLEITVTIIDQQVSFSQSLTVDNPVYRIVLKGL